MPTVLVADDNVALRALVRLTLVTQGWRVFEAESGTSALEMAARLRPDLIVLDVTFPEDPDGFVVCRKLKEASATARIPVLMLTARDSVNDRALAARAGAAAYISKPFGPLDLIGTLHQLMKDRQPAPSLGAYLLDQGALRPDQLERALAEQRRLAREGDSELLGEVAVRLGFVRPEDVVRSLERKRAATRVITDDNRPRIRVVIADDHVATRQGLSLVLSPEAGFDLVGLGWNAPEAVALVRERTPDLAVLDYDMTKGGSLEALRAIRAERPDVPVVLFTKDISVREAGLAAGAAAVVAKDTEIDELLEQLRRAARTGEPADRAGLLPTASWLARLPHGRIARQQRTVALLSVLVVAYVGAYIVAEPALGASAAILAVVSAAIAGAVLGPEAGVVGAILLGTVSLLLWSQTGHQTGEPVLVVGGNGLGLLALMGIGAGFGAMRVLRGRFDRHGRQVDALAEAGLILGGGARPESLSLLLEAALTVVPGEAALLYAGDRDAETLEVIALVGASRSLLGHREVIGFGAVGEAYRGAAPRIVGELPIRAAIPSLAGMRSALLVPLRVGEASNRGVLVVLSAAAGRYGPSDAATLTRFAGCISPVLGDAWLAALVEPVTAT